MSSLTPTTRLVITLCFMALLLVASVIPGQAQPGDSVFVWIVAKTPTLLQKSLHLLFYGALAFLLSWSFEPMQSNFQRLLAALVVTVCFGALMEWLQTSVPGRYGTILDVALNAAGALIGLVVATFLL